MEIEHLQHLLEHARIRLTRDFEHWYVHVYLESSQEEPEPCFQNVQNHQNQQDKEFTFPNAGAEAAKRVIHDSKGQDSVDNDIKAFYRSREMLLKSGRNTPSSFCK